jgi:hypothetical protein
VLRSFIALSCAVVLLQTKHVWFSASADLRLDAMRDLTDLGCHCNVIEG